LILGLQPPQRSFQVRKTRGFPFRHSSHS
jgi:hypothetical protein